jgi:hypothetical protein
VTERRLTVAGVELAVLNRPGYARGAISLYAPGLDTVFTGDTLRGVLVDRSYPNFLTIIGGCAMYS